MDVIFMNIYMYLIEFLLAFIIVYLYYRLIEAKKIKRFSKKNTPTDLKLFTFVTKADKDKISNKKLMNLLSIINAIDVGLVLLITNVVHSFVLKLMIAIPSIFGVIFISYTLVGYIFKKKGLTKNES